MSSGRCETQSSPAHAGRRSGCNEARDFNRPGRARPSIRQTTTPLRRWLQAALHHPSLTERLLCRRQPAARANPTRCSLVPEAAASTPRATNHSAARDQFCIRARRVSLATGPKTNSSERAATATGERWLRLPPPGFEKPSTFRLRRRAPLGGPRRCVRNVGRARPRSLRRSGVAADRRRQRRGLRPPPRGSDERWARPGTWSRSVRSSGCGILGLRGCFDRWPPT